MSYVYTFLLISVIMYWLYSEVDVICKSYICYYILTEWARCTYMYFFLLTSVFTYRGRCYIYILHLVLSYLSSYICYYILLYQWQYVPMTKRTLTICTSYILTYSEVDIVYVHLSSYICYYVLIYSEVDVVICTSYTCYYILTYSEVHVVIFLLTSVIIYWLIVRYIFS